MGLSQLIKSFNYAGKGIWLTFKEEQSFRVQLFFAVLVAALMIFFPLTTAERVLLILAIAMVLVLEIINSIFERIVDVYKPRLNPYVREIKDMMAGGVLIASAGSVAIGILIFLPYILDFFG